MTTYVEACITSSKFNVTRSARNITTLHHTIGDWARCDIFPFPCLAYPQRRRAGPPRFWMVQCFIGTPRHRLCSLRGRRHPYSTLKIRPKRAMISPGHVESSWNGRATWRGRLAQQPVQYTGRASNCKPVRTCTVQVNTVCWWAWKEQWQSKAKK